MHDCRPHCARCSDRVDRMQRSRGIVAAYPCLHWLTRGEANAMKAEADALLDAAQAALADC